MTQRIQVVYTAKARTQGGREGTSETSDGRLKVDLASPGTKRVGTNPEQLFAIGWSACFLSSLELVAGKMKVPFPADASDDIEVDLSGSDGYALRVRHNIRLPGVDRSVAQDLVKAGHEICPYSKATRGNIEVETNLL